MSKTRRLMAAQDGVAMAVAVMVLFVVLTLATAAVTASVQTTSSTQRDNSVKTALAAAEAGLETASYRLNMLHPEEKNKYCIGQSSAEVATETGGYCKGVKETLGNGSEFTYWTSEALGSSASCVGQDVTGQDAVMQRCVVAEGMAGKVKRRVTERIASFVAKPLFPITGVTGYKKLTLENNSYVKGAAGSNGKLTIKNNAEVSEASVLGPSGELVVGNNGKSGPVLKRSTSEGPIPVSSVNFGNSATENKNYYIANYLASPRKEPYDKAEKVTYSEETRKLSASNNATLVLKEGTYNFCSFEAQNNATVEVASGAKVIIYIDSYNDPNSKCPKTGSGVFKIWNNAEIKNPSGDPTALQIEVYDGSGEVYIKNNGNLYATLNAPLSKVNIENNGVVHGAITADELALGNNFKFEWDERAQNIKTGTVGNYYRSSWGECPPEKSSASPESGC